MKASKNRFIVSNDILVYDQSGLLTFNQMCQYILEHNIHTNMHELCSGYVINDFVFVDINSSQCTNTMLDIINDELCPKTRYLLPQQCYLYRKYKYGMPGNFYEDVISLDGSEGNFSNIYGPVRIIVPDLQNKIENDPITGVKYMPSISRTWMFEQPNSNAEWTIRESFSAM